MTSLSPEPVIVPAPRVRRLRVVDEILLPVQQVVVREVTAPHVVPRQIDPLGLRLMSLQLENDQLRAQVRQQCTA